MTVTGLLAASAFFTFGASLGITGGWAAKVGAFTSKIGLGGKMANIVAGAITQAGTGAWIGGIAGAATGQGFMKGAALGAAGGAVAGGAAGAVRSAGTAGLAQTGAAPVAEAGGSAAGVSAGSTATASTTVTAAGAGGEAGKSIFQKVMGGVVGAGGIGPIVQGVGAGFGQAAAAKERRAERGEDRDALAGQRAWEAEQRRLDREATALHRQEERDWQESQNALNRAQSASGPAPNTSYDIAYSPIASGFSRG